VEPLLALLDRLEGEGTSPPILLFIFLLFHEHIYYFLVIFHSLTHCIVN